MSHWTEYSKSRMFFFRLSSPASGYINILIEKIIHYWISEQGHGEIKLQSGLISTHNGLCAEGSGDVDTEQLQNLD